MCVCRRKRRRGSHGEHLIVTALIPLKITESIEEKERTERVEIEFTELEKCINLLNCEGKVYPYLYNLKII